MSCDVLKREDKMIRLIAVAGFALAVANSAQAMTPAPIPQPDGMITQVAAGCGAGRTMISSNLVGCSTGRSAAKALGIDVPPTLLARRRGDRMM
jgi:hypothetical protein